VTKFDRRIPTPGFYLDVKDADGKVGELGLRNRFTNALFRRGFKKTF